MTEKKKRKPNNRPYKRLSTIVKERGFVSKRAFLIDLLERHNDVRDAAEEIGMTFQGLYKACEKNGISVSHEKKMKVTLD